jgi:hypothetical protein
MRFEEMKTTVKTEQNPQIQSKSFQIVKITGTYEYNYH